MPAPKIKNPAFHHSHAEKPAADSTPFFKSMGTINSRLESLRTGRPAKLMGAELVDAHRLVADHRRSQAEKVEADFEKLTNDLNSVRSLLKNRGNA